MRALYINEGRFKMEYDTKKKNIIVRWVSVLNLLFLFVFSQAFAMASDFNTPWIFARQTDSLSRVFFRKTIVSQGMPRQAKLTVATTGYCKVYVNECKIGTSPYLPLRHENDTDAVEQTFDITPYMRGDSNVVAVIYSPLPNHTVKTQKQIALNLYGTDCEQRDFCVRTDASWLCRESYSRIMTNGTEVTDGRKRDTQWKAATIYDNALWVHAEEAKDTTTSRYAKATPLPKISHVDTWYGDSIQGNAILPPNAFYGFFRATLRGARKGERIRLGNLLYICNGKLDEQAFPEFGANYMRGINVSGKASRITTLEMINIGEQNPSFYH